MDGNERSDADLTGVVLAGGYSRRYGETDKALARVDGRPMLAGVVARVGSLADAVVVNCRPDQRAAFETALAPTPVSVRFAEDAATDRGPLYGFRTALERVDTDGCVLATCDTPFLDPRLLSGLAERLETGDEAVAVRTADGIVQPVQAVYRTGPAESAGDELLGDGERRLSALVERLACRTVPAAAVPGDAARSLFDVNRPEDRAQAVEVTSGGRAGR